MSGLPPRFPITGEQIDQVMTVFYSAVRRDPVLGPIFEGHVDDWPEHVEKIGRFWRNAILFERNYDGNPMVAHMQAGDVRAKHFTGWLELFDQSLNKVLAEETAAQWSALAHRIGRGLRMGVQDLDQPKGGVPFMG